MHIQQALLQRELSSDQTHGCFSGVPYLSREFLLALAQRPPGVVRQSNSKSLKKLILIDHAVANSHSLMGYLIYRAADHVGEKRWRTVAVFLFAANIPDLDFIPGLFVGDPC
jgi:hypothetical protein